MKVSKLLKLHGMLVLTVHPDFTLAEVARRFAMSVGGRRFSLAVVTESDDQVLGVISLGDIAHALGEQEEKAAKMLVKEVMTTDVISCGLDDDLEDVLRTMAEKGIRHMPVIEGSRLAGLVARRDALEFLYTQAVLDTEDIRKSQQEMFLTTVGVLSIVPFSFPLWFALSRRLRRYARRRALLSMDEARLADPRRPVLFLRSFGDDQVSLAQAKVPWLLRFFDPLAIVGTLEELLLRELGYLGPVVAIGNPSDRLPPLGAARRYCWGEEWREIVGSLMDEASLIIVGAARSEGLAWEIATLREKGLLSKTVFILPPASSTDHAALDRLFGLLGAGETTSDPVLDRSVIALSFPAPDYGLLLVSARASETEYELALRVPQLADLALFRRTSATALPELKIKYSVT